MRDRALSYGTEKSSVGQSSLVMLEKAVLFGTLVSCGTDCLMGTEQCKTEQSNMGQSSVM